MNDLTPVSTVRTLLPRPLPVLDGPHQPGIVDPVWTVTAPPGVDSDVYGRLYAGRVERQNHLHIVTADVETSSRHTLMELLKALGEGADHQMRKPPVIEGVRPLDLPLASRRVTVSIGFGASLFTTPHGDDRFGLAARRPLSLKIMSRMFGDDERVFDPQRDAADVIILIASDDFYVNEYIASLLLYRRFHPDLGVRRIEHGYARPDNREPSGFEDGISNPTAHQNETNSFVFVSPVDGEPDWCVDGTYLGYRKIRRRMKDFFALRPLQRERVFGVHRTSGERLTDAPPSAHTQKMNPRRPGPDFMGIHDLSRRMVRRPYFFSEGLDSEGEEVRGILHLSFTRNLAANYEWPIQMWQLNPDFPTPGAGVDALYGKDGGAANIGGGFYFFPPARGDQPQFGAAMFV